MKVIVVRHPYGKSRVFHLQGARLIWGAVLAVAFLLAAGFSLCWHMMNLNRAGVLSRNELQGWHTVLDQQQKAVDEMRGTSVRELDALAIQLARISGQLMRLDALGERLVTMADLSDDEFNFGEAPALGGPGDSQDTTLPFQVPAFSDQIDELAIKIDQRAEQLEVLESLLLDRNLQDDVYLAGRPIRKGWLSSAFGKRTDPFTGKQSWHKGMDFAAKDGSDVIAVGSGVVTWSGRRNGYGILVEINHGNGYVTRYSHNKENIVKVGDIISRGQVISLVGSSGRSTGPHVHFEVLLNGKQVDPTRYISRTSR